MEELDTPANKIGESAQRIIDRALVEARRRSQALSTEHVFLAFAEVEWDLFAEITRDLELNPHVILREVEEQLRRLPAAPDDPRGAPVATRLAMKLAAHHANRAGRSAIEAGDLVAAICETHGAATILRRHGVEPERLAARLDTRLQQEKLRDGRLQERFELPPALRQMGTNLNLLAYQDKLPPVYGRDREIQQLLEILSHRERANSAILVGEPGVGKTAVVEGLARRIEFEPEAVPVRLRNAQVVSLQMNTMVAGTMLRGMFEDRIQNVIRDLKTHPNLILFIDEVHTMAYGARFLKRVIDEHVKIPISTRWQEATTFRVAVRNAAVVVDVLLEQPVVTREGFEELASGRLQ